MSVCLSAHSPDQDQGMNPYSGGFSPDGTR